jgi:hypothetical protein
MIVKHLAWRISASLEKVGGALEGLLRAGDWNVGYLDPPTGQLSATRRGWFGVRELNFSLNAEGSETVVELAYRIKEAELVILREHLEERLGCLVVDLRET